jgi:DNA-directed RNA polymerase subunit alpha
VRRVLLSSLRGAAVWAFRIDGVVHEHQTIQGVVEDVHQVIQNLKALVITLDPDVDEAVLELRVDKAGPVTAAAIQAASGATVIDPGHHLFTLQESRSLTMELHVNKGRGFVLADAHPIPRGAPVDLVRIDAIYNPVRRANFSVEETRVGQRTDFDRLTLHVETDGSVAPERAVAYAAELVRKHLEYMLYFRAGFPRWHRPVPSPCRKGCRISSSVPSRISRSSRSAPVTRCRRRTSARWATSFSGRRTRCSRSRTSARSR